MGRGLSYNAIFAADAWYTDIRPVIQISEVKIQLQNKYIEMKYRIYYG